MVVNARKAAAVESKCSPIKGARLSMPPASSPPSERSSMMQRADNEEVSYILLPSPSNCALQPRASFSQCQSMVEARGKDRERIQPEQYERSSAARARAAARLPLFLALAAHDLRLSLQVILSIDPWLARRLTTTSHHRVRAGIPRTRQACTGDRNAANLEHATALCLPSDCNLEQAQGRFTTVDYSSQSFGERDTHRSCAWPTPC
jgi:hypothetical protein